jgi:hypothetical protein
MATPNEFFRRPVYTFRLYGQSQGDLCEMQMQPCQYYMGRNAFLVRSPATCIDFTVQFVCYDQTSSASVSAQSRSSALGKTGKA